MKEIKPFIDQFTGTLLTPSHNGKKCLGNGEHDGIECCCDECEYLCYCFKDECNINT